MSTKKTKTVLIAIAILLVGYLAGALIGWPNPNTDILSGDIGKVNRHKSDVVSSKMSLLEERLLTDSVFFGQTTSTLIYLAARTAEFEEYAAYTEKVVPSYSALSQYKEPMQKIVSFAKNANAASNNALVMLNQIKEEETTGSDIENAINNAFLSFMMVQKQSKVSEDFVSSADDFLKGKDASSYEDLLLARHLWASFNLVEAIQEGEKTLISLWSDKMGAIAPLSVTMDQIPSVDSNLLAAVTTSAIFNGQDIVGVCTNFAETLNLLNFVKQCPIYLGQSNTSFNFSFLNSGGKVLDNQDYMKVLVMNADQLKYVRMNTDQLKLRMNTDQLKAGMANQTLGMLLSVEMTPISPSSISDNLNAFLGMIIIIPF